MFHAREQSHSYTGSYLSVKPARALDLLTQIKHSRAGSLYDLVKGRKKAHRGLATALEVVLPDEIFRYVSLRVMVKYLAACVEGRIPKSAREQGWRGIRCWLQQEERGVPTRTTLRVATMKSAV